MKRNNQLDRVMETGDHLKNGASLKSHMSRINILFLTMLFLSSVNGYAQFSGGNGNQGTPYLISSKADMATLAEMLDYGYPFVGKYFLLTQDLKNFNVVTSVIGTASKPFNGIFDGGGHEIEMSLNTTGDVGLFGYVDNATIQNLTVSGNISTSSGTSAGGICAYASNSSIDNCQNTASVSATSSITITSGTNSSSSYAGGICGYATNTPVNNSSNTGNISSYNTGKTGDYLSYSNSYSGGICGYTTGSLINCHNTGIVSSSSESYAYTMCLAGGHGAFSYSNSYSGGICGYATNSIINCYNYGNIFYFPISTAGSWCSGGYGTNTYSYAYAGGICGYATSSLTDCYNSGNLPGSSTISSTAGIKNSYSYLGGICGYSSENLTNCYNKGNISEPVINSTNYSFSSGGICGLATTGNLSNCYNTGDILFSNFSSGTGGRGGICGNGSNIRIENSFAANTKITSTNSANAGRILGTGTNTAIANCYALSSMTINNITVFAENTTNERNGQNMDIASFQSQNWISTYLGWNFTTIWKQRQNEFPVLFYQNYPPVITFSIPQIKYGEQITLNAISDNTSTPIIYETSDNTVAEISGNTLIAKKAGNVVITARQDANNDYLAGETTVNLTIQKCSLNVTPHDAIRVYGSSNPPFTVSFSGFVNGDNETAITTLPIATTTATQASPTGAYNITCSGGNATNYSFSYGTGTLTITKATLTATADDKDRVYGANNPTFTITYSGFKNGESQSVINILPKLSCTATVTANVGTYPIVVSGGDVTNYDFNYQDGTLTINKAVVTVNANDASMTYGDTSPAFSCQYSGFVNGETSSVLTSLPSISCSASSTSNAGNYPIIPSDAKAQNYSFIYQNGMLTISKAPLTITAEDKTRMQGQPNPEFTLVYDGFRNNETADVLYVLPTISCAANIYSPVGSYDIVLSGGSDINYQYTLINGRLEVIALTGLNNVSATPFSIFPNPVASDLYIKSDLPIERVEVCSLAGTLVMQEKNVSEKISVAALSKGVYLLKIYTGKGVAVSKVVKE